MTLYLHGANRWTYVPSPIPSAPDALWQRKNDHTLQVIHNRCEPGQQDLDSHSRLQPCQRHLYETNDNFQTFSSKC